MKRGRYLLITVVVIACHQLARMALFGGGEAIIVLPFFSLVEVWNRGISFGMFNDLTYGQWFLSGMGIVVSLFLLRLLFITDSERSAAAFALIIGGAIGNVIDRLRFGAVADYLDFHAFDYHWPAFNLTDSAIFIGVLLLLLPTRIKKRRRRRR